MTTETQVLIAFLLYLTFFGWIGSRRGFVSEATLLVVTVVSWVLLQERGTIVVRLTNFAGKFLVLVQSGGLAGSAEDALTAVSNAPNVITDENVQGFLFLVWAVIVLLTYIITSDPRITKKSKHKGLAILTGVLNGIIFAALLLPVLAQLLEPSNAAVADTAPLGMVVAIITGLWDLFARSLQTFWTWVQPVPAGVWLLIITLLLLLIAWPMRRSASGKK